MECDNGCEMRLRQSWNGRGSGGLGLLLVAALAASCKDWPGISKDGGFAGATRMEDKTGNIGSSCGSEVKCATGLTCVTKAPGGMCTKSCNSDADCVGGSCQLASAWGGMICFKRCQNDQMCRDQYDCVSTGTANICAQAVAPVDASNLSDL
jgi:hypothetical protein